MNLKNNHEGIESNAQYYFNKFAEDGILEYIFSHIAYRRSLALVNKLFYKTVCKVDNSMNIFRARFEHNQIVWRDGYRNENIFSSVYCTHRNFTEIFINNIYLVDILDDKFLKNYTQSEFLLGQTLRKISGNVVKFTLFSCLMTESQLIGILGSLNKNKLKEINIIEGAIIHEKINYINKTMNLEFPILERLDLSGTKYGNPILDDPVYHKNEMYSFLRSIGEYSLNLQYLSIHESLVHQINIRNMKLKHLCIEQASPVSIRLAEIVSLNVNYLTTVDFLNCYVMEDVLNEILSAQHLEILKINMDGISLRGFINIAHSQRLKELGLKCSNSCKWIINAISMHKLDFLEKIFLDIKDLSINYVELSKMLNKNIQNVHVITSHHYIMGSLFISPYVDNLKTCTIELYVDKSKASSLLVNDCTLLVNLREFTLINRNEKSYDIQCDFSKILNKCLFLEKLRIEGFEVTSKLFEVAIKGHYNLKELYLIGPKNIECNFIFDKNVSEPISLYGRKLKILEISCAKSKLKRSYQFPFISRRGNVKIFRFR